MSGQRGFARLFIQAVKFGAVGVLNTALTMATFSLLTRALGIGEYWANAAGYAVGFVNSFLWNKLWTFKSRKFRVSEFALFALVALAAYGVQLPFFRLFNSWHLQKEFAEFLAMVPYTVVGFLGNKFLTFRKGNAMHESVKPGSIALVTGASSGIGAAIARELGRRGYRVALAARSAEKLQALAAEIAKEGGPAAWALRADLSRADGPAALHAECSRLGIEPSILVNNAGSGIFGETIEFSKPEKAAELRAMIALNATSLTELCALFGNDMAARGSGTILNVASMVASMPVPFEAAYAGSKAYVKNFSAALRAELRPRGVRACCLYPGYVRTNFDAASHADSEAYKAMSAKMGMAPEKVARIAVRQIRSGRANVVTGVMNSIAAAMVALVPKGLIARVTYGYLKKLISKG